SGAAVDLADSSKSLLMDAIHYRTYEMPPDGKLSDEEIATISRWVDMKIPWSPETANLMIENSLEGIRPPEVNEETKAFWSFQKVNQTLPPNVQNESWVSNDIDRFILSKLENAKLQPAKPATKQVLVRRLYYDLLGLPPTPSDVKKFAASQDEKAYEKLVYQLLDSPHYGEKWGRHWLDLVRYAETNSFERDGKKPFVWRYRDYVIRSFNEDKPYDQFLIEQLAGDELPNPTNDSIMAMGYYRIGQWDDEPADRKLALYDDLDDILATTTQSMLGLTVNCARCHDHKIDPIPTVDYYRMLAFFRNVKRYGIRGHDTVLAASSRQLEYESQPDEEIIIQHREKITACETSINEILDIVKSDFTPVELEDFRYLENHERLVHARLDSQVIDRKQFDQYIRARNKMRHLQANPPHLFRVLCVTENGPDSPATRVLIRGNPHAEGEQVEPGFVSVLSPPNPDVERNVSNGSSGRRLALAKWIASEDNPLTARVMVNRIWQHHFGRGIVRTPNDFGFQGDRPTHPKLLDYLATQFVDGGWSLKKLHKLILLSNTYRMSGQYNNVAQSLDPLNQLYWRFEMRRLTAEELRDSILSVSGRLNADKMFGPSIFTRLSKEVLAGQSMPGNGWGHSSEFGTRRRSIYIHVKRSLRVPLLEAFDAADTDTTCPSRFNTTQPTQALALLNGEFVNREAFELSKIVRSLSGSTSEFVKDVLGRVTQDRPTDFEVAQGVKLIEAWQGEDGVNEEDAFAFFCLAAFNLNEFVFLE
ncbi:MAG: DUF1549 and DUF1553 domain-containing protein, partial [Planctomycetota bacterium]